MLQLISFVKHCSTTSVDPHPDVKRRSILMVQNGVQISFDPLVSRTHEFVGKVLLNLNELIENKFNQKSLARLACCYINKMLYTILDFLLSKSRERERARYRRWIFSISSKHQVMYYEIYIASSLYTGSIYINPCIFVCSPILFPCSISEPSHL